VKSELMYERIRHGEIRPPLTDEDRVRLEALNQADETYWLRHPQTVPRRTRRLVWTVPLAALLVAAVGLTLLPQTESDTRVKGAALSLMAYHKLPEGIELLTPTSRLGSGDEIQLAYFAAQKQYAAIVSLDSRGVVTTHLPLHGSQAVEIQTPRPELLPYSYTLDDAPAFETFYLITSSRPFEVAKLLPFVRGTGPGRGTPGLQLPSDFDYTAFRLLKKEPDQ
jgi:hypothetical protein